MTVDYRHMPRRTLLAAGATATGLSLLGLPRLAGAAYQESDVTNPGSISGVVAFDGTPPKADEVLISKDHEHCGEGHVIPDPLEIGENGRLGHGIVALRGIESGKAWAPNLAAPKILQARCKFEPYVQIAPKGSELTIVNEDPLLHNIHAYEIIGRARRTMFNIAQPQAGQVDTHGLKLRRGHLVEIDCDAHNWMSAWIYTSDHPYVAALDAQGGYAIDGIPPGSYELVAWHPALGEVAREVTVAADKSESADLTFTA